METGMGVWSPPFNAQPSHSPPKLYIHVPNAGTGSSRSCTRGGAGAYKTKETWNNFLLPGNDEGVGDKKRDSDESRCGCRNGPDYAARRLLHPRQLEFTQLVIIFSKLLCKLFEVFKESKNTLHVFRRTIHWREGAGEMWTKHERDIWALRWCQVYHLVGEAEKGVGSTTIGFLLGAEQASSQGLHSVQFLQKVGNPWERLTTAKKCQGSPHHRIISFYRIT